MQQVEGDHSSEHISESDSFGRPARIKVCNYDVLLEEEASGKLNLLSCPHVGNNRLEVLLLMNRTEFEENLVAGVDTNPILDKIVDIVTNQCVPSGRFLVSIGDYDPELPQDENEWEQIELGRARQFLNIALSDGKKAGLLGFPSFVDGAMPPPPVGKGNNAEKKRLRRSSLLRRSVSESFVRNVTNNGNEEKPESKEAKKKTANRRHSSFWSIRKQKASDKVTQPEELDVLFNFEQTALLPGHVGNNRLHVLLNIHKEKYEKSDESEQTGSLQEWIRTVTQFWGGRFLRQEEEDSDAFETLDANQAELALHSVISELTHSADDPTLIEPTQNTAMATVDKVAPPNLNVQDMRSAAVQSLQKRKKRQGLASRLRNLAASTLTRRSSSASQPPADNAAARPTQGVARATSVPVFTSNGGSHGAYSLPTSPTPLDDQQQPARSQRRSSANSFSLTRFLSGRASLRRSQNLAADGVGRDLRASFEADDRDFGPESFGEYANRPPILE